MPYKWMKPRVGILIVAILLAITVQTSYALMSVGVVTTERAKELGIDIRARASGPKHVWIELEFDPEEQLKEFHHVSMEIRDGKELLVGYDRLEANRTESGTVVFKFMASRSYLDKITLRIVEVYSPLSSVGHDLRLRDHIDLEELR